MLNSPGFYLSTTATTLKQHGFDTDADSITLPKGTYIVVNMTHALRIDAEKRKAQGKKLNLAGQVGFFVASNTITTSGIENVHYCILAKDTVFTVNASLDGQIKLSMDNAPIYHSTIRNNTCYGEFGKNSSVERGGMLLLPRDTIFGINKDIIFDLQMALYEAAAMKHNGSSVKHNKLSQLLMAMGFGLRFDQKHIFEAFKQGLIPALAHKTDSFCAQNLLMFFAFAIEHINQFLHRVADKIEKKQILAENENTLLKAIIPNIDMSSIQLQTISRTIEQLDAGYSTHKTMVAKMTNQAALDAYMRNGLTHIDIGQWSCVPALEPQRTTITFHPSELNTPELFKIFFTSKFNPSHSLVFSKNIQNRCWISDNPLKTSAASTVVFSMFGMACEYLMDNASTIQKLGGVALAMIASMAFTISQKQHNSMIPRAISFVLTFANLVSAYCMLTATDDLMSETITPDNMCLAPYSTL